MKKILMLFAVTMLVLSFSSNAMAAFGYDELIRVVYSSGGSYTTEQVTDMGSISSLLGGGTQTISANPIDTSSFTTGGATASDTYVAYFVVGSVNGSPVGVSGSGSTQSNQGGYYDAVRLAFSQFIAGHTSATNFTVDQSMPNSYNQLFNLGAPGMFYAFLDGTGDNNMEALLTNLGSSGTVTQTLFMYSSPNAGSSGVSSLTLTTNADGSTTITPTAVPLPAPIVLFGTGLVSLLGIRRKQSAQAV